jgi:D-alanyl-D-alanine carboxypeptidase
MNATARRMGMTGTRYTDPSGLDPSTTSTAADRSGSPAPRDLAGEYAAWGVVPLPL